MWHSDLKMSINEQCRLGYTKSDMILKDTNLLEH